MDRRSWCAWMTPLIWAELGKIQAVIWDLAGVLMHTNYGDFNSMLASKLQVPQEEAERVMESRENSLWDLDELDEDEFFGFILQELNLPAHKRETIKRVYTEDCYINTVLLTYIRGLRVSYKTALLTNFPAHIHDFMRTTWRMDGAFDQIIASCDVKLLKPDARIFQLTLDRLNVAAEAAVFIDDRWINVSAAQAFGMQGILYQNRAQVMADLESLLLVGG